VSTEIEGDEESDVFVHDNMEVHQEMILVSPIDDVVGEKKLEKESRNEYWCC
jgi:hypothetical protein